MNRVPKKTGAAIARGLNTVGDNIVHNAAQVMADTTGLDPNDIIDMIVVKQATADDLKWSMDASKVAPPSMDWSRPWDQRQGDFDNRELVKVVTSFDKLVCDKCLEVEKNSPYTLEEVQTMNPYGNGIVHPNCLLPGSVVEGGVVAGLKAFYAGEAIEVVTAEGHRLALTVNHPVLTPNGMIAAGALCKGDKLVAYRGEVYRQAFSSARASKIEQYEKPTAIEEVYGALATLGRCSVAATVDDLHGDARFVHGDVDVVYADRKLLLDVQSAITKHRRHLGFMKSDVKQSLVACSGSREIGFQATGTAADRSMGVRDLFGFLRRRHEAPLAISSFGMSSQWDIPLAQEPLYGKSRREAELASDLIGRHSAQIQLDEVVDLRRFKYVGHVYDLQTMTGWMIANGIVVSNCRCMVQAWYATRQLPVTFGRGAKAQLFTMRELGEKVAEELKVTIRAIDKD